MSMIRMREVVQGIPGGSTAEWDEVMARLDKLQVGQSLPIDFEPYQNPRTGQNEPPKEVQGLRAYLQKDKKESGRAWRTKVIGENVDGKDVFTLYVLLQARATTSN